MHLFTLVLVFTVIIVYSIYSKPYFHHPISCFKLNVAWLQIVEKKLYFLDMKEYNGIIYHLLTESEVITGKSQTEVLKYWPSDSEVNTSMLTSGISL